MGIVSPNILGVFIRLTPELPCAISCAMRKTALVTIVIWLVLGTGSASAARPEADRVPGEIPGWLAESETYGFGSDLEAVNGTAWKFITHTPHTEEFLKAARSRGIRAFPYMTFYQAPLMEKHQGMRLSQHPDWILIGKTGVWAPTGFWESEDAKNMYCTCPNVRGYADAVLAYLETLMKRGAAGIFLDNVHPNRECFGERLGKHTHLFETQIEAFADLMRRAREVIKRYDPEGALLINSADPATLPAEFWPHTDAEMSESYICTWVSETRWGDWARNWNGLDRKIPAGKQVCCLSYLGHNKKQSFKEDAFFCYASARLMNFIWGTGYDKAKVGDDSAVRRLYAITLGRPESPEIVKDEVHFRRFRGGLVAVNPTDRDRSLPVDGIPTSLLKDIFNEADIQAEGGACILSVPKQSGRVYLFKPGGAGLNAADPRGNHALFVKTEPGLGKTRFELDGLPMMTYSGRWTTEYVKGENYGTFVARFDEPGWHTLKIVDDVRKEMLVANSYEDAYALNETQMPGATAEKRDPARLGKLMDPSEPARFSEGKPFRFTGWDGPVKSAGKAIKVYVDGPTAVIARFARKNN